jgi:hypothetical protein
MNEHGCPDCGQLACVCFDDDEEDVEITFDCPAFLDGGHMYCPLAGTEDCDWECPHGGYST